jgi:hypothetical protein
MTPLRFNAAALQLNAILLHCSNNTIACFMIFRAVSRGSSLVVVHFFCTTVNCNLPQHVLTATTMRAFSVLAAVAAVVSTAAANNVVRIPMKKISDKEFVAQKLANAATGSTFGYHAAPGPGQVIVKDYQNAQYFGVVSLGGQDFEVM